MWSQNTKPPKNSPKGKADEVPSSEAAPEDIDIHLSPQNQKKQQKPSPSKNSKSHVEPSPRKWNLGSPKSDLQDVTATSDLIPKDSELGQFLRRNLKVDDLDLKTNFSDSSLNEDLDLGDLSARDVGESKGKMDLRQGKIDLRQGKLNLEQGETKRKTPPSVESSSDSVFTDALSPGCSTEINACYYSEGSLEVEVPEVPQDLTLALNNFKLNDFRARREEEINRKMAKLGVVNVSQISLDADPRDSFTRNVVVMKDYVDGDRMDLSSPYCESGIHSITNGGDYDEFPSTSQSDGIILKRHLSEPAGAEPCGSTGDGFVLKKVASLTLDRAALDSKIVKPKFVPEKLDFTLYEKFEGE